MNWQEVCEHPSLHDLPFKIELNVRNGRTLPECAIHTRKGIRVADVVWASDAVFAQIKHEAACSVCPEICIEVVSASNTDEEMREKRKLYFEQGAKEVWLCSEQGGLRFFTVRGEMPASALAPEFPKHIEL